MAKITVGRQHNQIVTDAELGEQRINSSDLNAAAAARIAELGRIDMVIARRDDHRKGGEEFQNLRPSLWSPIALQ